MRCSLRGDTIITHPCEQVGMTDSGEPPGLEGIGSLWDSLDDGWKATIFALGISVVVHFGGGIPW